MYMQRTTSGAARNGLYTTNKYMRGAAGIGLGTTIKHLRCTTSAGRREQWPEHHDNPPYSIAAFVINSEPHTGARPSVRLFVGPELARCLHSLEALFIFSESAH